MKIDNITEYNVLSEKSFSFRNQKFTLNGEEKIMYDNCKEIGMRDIKALEISRFASSFEKEISTKDEWSSNELLIIIRDVLARKAGSTKDEKDILESQLALLKK